MKKYTNAQLEMQKARKMPKSREDKVSLNDSKKRKKIR